MSETSPRVSFIITTRNRADFLAETLRNIREFITPRDELIIVDGASTDHTAAVVGANADIVTRFISEADKSEGHAFNKALFCCQGLLIKPLADDDFVHSAALARVIDLMIKRPDIDVIQCGGEIWDETPAGPKFRCFRRINPRHATDPSELFWATHHFLGMIFRRSAAILVGGVNPRFRSIDGDMFLKFQESGCTIKYCDINLYKWCVYRHSGMLRTSEVERDYVAFRQRLYGSRSLFELSEDQAMEIYRLSGVSHARDFVKVVRCAYAYLSSGSGFMLGSLSFFLRATLRIRSTVRRWFRVRAPMKLEDAPSVPNRDPWTGDLV